VVTLNAPDRRNALTPAMAAELLATFDETDWRPIGNFRREVVDGAVAWDVAMQYERPAQLWSMRRSADR
jgi:enoyl-CoA hydratase